MWPNNGYGNNGHFPQNNFNQDDFTQSQFGGGNPQRIFQTQPNMMPFDEMNGDSFMENNSFQPEVGIYNDSAFMQNQFVNQVSFVVNPNPDNYYDAVAPSSPSIECC